MHGVLPGETALLRARAIRGMTQAQIKGITDAGLAPSFFGGSDPNMDGLENL